MTERLSWQEIREQYPDEWVALVDDDLPDTLADPRSGTRPDLP